MSVTIAETQNDELHFVNIVSLAQDRLTSNFRNLSNRLKKHDDILTEHEVMIKELNQNTIDDVEYKIGKQREQINQIKGLLTSTIQTVELLKKQQCEHERKISYNDQRILKFNDEFTDLKFMLGQNSTENRQSFQQAWEQIDSLKKQVQRAFDQIIKKESIVEVMKIQQTVTVMNQKSIKNDDKFQKLKHDLETMEIINQKNQRNQSKKDAEFIKQIEEKIKKQIKNLSKNFNSSTTNQFSSTMTSNFESINEENIQQSKKQIQPKQHIHITQNTNKHIQFQQEEQKNITTLRRQSQMLAVVKMSESIKNLQTKLKALEISVQKISLKKMKQKQIDPETKIMEKINQIKPELIKIWSKCDTIDDRIAFTDRKLEEKTKCISNIMNIHKQNNLGKIEEKLKNFQTQVYATFKELKNKLDNKVNLTEYEKYTKTMDQRIKQMNELIFLKSDKMEVKKALLFLQSKMKEIILVISEQQQNQMDVLLTKKQLKCMSCDKDIDKIPKGAINSSRGNWDAMPYKENSPEILGKFGMTGFGSLAKKLKKLEGGDLPILNRKKSKFDNNSLQNGPSSSINKQQ